MDITVRLDSSAVDNWTPPPHVITCVTCGMQLGSRPGWTLDHIDDGSHIARPEVEPDPIF